MKINHQYFYSIESRQKANTLIIKGLQAYLNKYPGIRFNQMLVNLGVVIGRYGECDDFYTESETILKRLNKKYKHKNKS